MAWVLLAQDLWGQSQVASQHRIAGVVVDERGEPMVGAWVVCAKAQETMLQTITDAQGKFSFVLSRESMKGCSLRVSFMGYREKRVELLSNQEHYTIRLDEADQQLEEVVVTGYVDQPRQSYTGSMSVIGREVLDRQPGRNMMQILRSEVPGFEQSVDIVQGSNPNKVPELILRGRSTFVEGDRTNAPLFVLDGMEVDLGTVFDLRTDLVEQVTILKDAAATAFYGSKAASGVVVITTRAPKEGELRLRVDTHWQLAFPDLTDYRLLNAADKLEYERLSGMYGKFTGEDQLDIDRQKEYYDKLSRVNMGVNTSWIKLPLRTGLVHSHQLELSGGTNRFRYSLLGGWKDTQGVMQQSGRKSGTLRVQLSYGSMDKTWIQYVTSYTTNKQQDIPYGKFSDYALLNPYDSPYLPDGSLNRVLSFQRANPLYEKGLGSYIRQSNTQFSAALRVRTRLSASFRLEGTASWICDKSAGDTFYDPLSSRFLHTEADKKGLFSVTDGTKNELQANAFAVYNKAMGNALRHNLRCTVGGNVQLAEMENHGYQAVGVLSGKLDHSSMAGAFAPGTQPLGGKGISRLLGAYVNAAYSYDNKYFTEASFRYEGSSKFGLNNRFAPFGSLSLGWNLHKEPWMPQQVFELLKMRLSAGYVGNASFSPYEARLSYRYHAIHAYNHQAGAMPVGLVNDRLKWERSLKTNVGLDFSLLNDRLSGSIDVYRNRTHDLILTVAKPPHMGFKDGKENLGEIENQGIEASIRARLLDGPKGSLSAYLTASHNKNRILKIGHSLRNKDAQGLGRSPLPVRSYTEGESMTALRVFPSLGISPTNGREVFLRSDGSYTYRYDWKDRKVVGDTTPTIAGNLGLSVSFLGQWEFALSCLYRLGASLYNQTLATKVEGHNPMDNADYRVLQGRWSAVGMLAPYKNIAHTDHTPATSRFVFKEYALEGSSLTISHRCSKRLIQRIGLKQMHIVATLNDFFHWSSIKRERGLDYPFSRQVQLSINLGF